MKIVDLGTTSYGAATFSSFFFRKKITFFLCFQARGKVFCVSICRRSQLRNEWQNGFTAMGGASCAKGGARGLLARTLR